MTKILSACCVVAFLAIAVPASSDDIRKADDTSTATKKAETATKKAADDTKDQSRKAADDTTNATRKAAHGMEDWAKKSADAKDASKRTDDATKNGVK